MAEDTDESREPTKRLPVRISPHAVDEELQEESACEGHFCPTKHVSDGAGPAGKPEETRGMQDST